MASIYNSDRVVNPLALNFYVLGYDGNGNLTRINNATKENLKTYLGHHRILTDAINIKDAYIINLGIEFDIITMPDQNGNQVILRCINRLKQYFDIKKWQINQPIIISNVLSTLLSVKGVQSVVKAEFTNLSGGNYSPYSYDVQGAIRNGILYPSLDPSIFEIRFPDLDIQGRVVTF